METMTIVISMTGRQLDTTTTVTVTVTVTAARLTAR